MNTKLKTYITIFSTCLITNFAVFAQVTFDQKTLGDLRARHLGPSAMSGRISCIDADNNKNGLIYVGSAGGGVWKSIDFGLTYKAVFDKYNQSIGAVTINQKNTSQIWVGTGETWTRNSVSAGDGIYLSNDGGESWKKMGLENSERINKIIIDPNNDKVVYVAVTGALWSDSEERGVYKTTDGGQSWKKVLYVDAKTGCADITMDPSNPSTLIAAMWEFRRTAYSFSSGGKASCLMKSTDGGNTWKKISAGLPSGDMGRIAVTFSPADDKVVYATIESKESAMYRSNDKGENWVRTGTHNFIIERPFYFSKLIADPKNTDRIYRAGLTMLVSNDGGKSFNSFNGSGHGDFHDLWINPINTENLIVATDGGVFTSHDRGAHFYQHRNLPVGQFYHVNYDLQKEYFVYGGLQDNGSWMGPAFTNTYNNGNRNWSTVGYGDGFWVVPDLTDPNFVYWESQGGELMRFNKTTKTSKSIKPVELAGEPRYRYNWNSPISTGVKNKNRLYYGSQYLLLSTDKGESWKKISPDLTTNDPQKQKQDNSGGITYDNSSAENHCTIYTICESPLNENVIWVGTDDGNLQLTRDGGKSWTNLISKVSGLASPAWVSSINCSNFTEGKAYVTFDRHTSGDFKSYMFITEDYGQTWKRLGESQLKGYLHVVKEDIVDQDLIFAGSENGLFLSKDKGQNWYQVEANNNMPAVAVRDIQIHPNTNDLILATHGRGIIIFDDISVIRQLKPEVLNKAWHIFPVKPYAYTETGFDYILHGDDEYNIPNPKNSFSVTYYLQKKHMGGDFNIQLLNEKNEVIQQKTAGKRKGLNIVEVDLSRKPPKMPPAPMIAYAGFIGAPLNPGNYKIRLIKDNDTLTEGFKIIPDAASQHSEADQKSRMELIEKSYDLCNDFTYTVLCGTHLNDLALANSSNAACPAGTKKQIDLYISELKKLHDKVVDSKQGMITDNNKFLRDKISGLYAQVVNYKGKPSTTQFERYQSLKKESDELAAELKKLNDNYLPKINESLKKAGINEMKVPDRNTVFSALK